MISFSEELLKQMFRIRYDGVLRELGGGKAIVENVCEPCKLKPVLSWHEVLGNHRINCYAAIVFDAPAPKKMMQRLFLLGRRGR